MSCVCSCPRRLGQERKSLSNMKNVPLLTFGLHKSLLLHHFNLVCCDFINFNRSYTLMHTLMLPTSTELTFTVKHFSPHIKCSANSCVDNWLRRCPVHLKESLRISIPVIQDVPDSNSNYNSFWLLVIKAEQHVWMFE